MLFHGYGASEFGLRFVYRVCGSPSQYQTKNGVRVSDAVRGVLVVPCLTILVHDGRCLRAQTAPDLHTHRTVQLIRGVSSLVGDPMVGGVYDGVVRNWVFIYESHNDDKGK
jgi:hypothetical protein